MSRSATAAAKPEVPSSGDGERHAQVVAAAAALHPVADAEAVEAEQPDVVVPADPPLHPAAQPAQRLALARP